MPDFVARNKRMFAALGVFLLAMVIAHLAKKDDAASAAGDPMFGPTPQVELTDRTKTSTPVDTTPKRPTRQTPTGYEEVEVADGGSVSGTVKLEKKPTLWTLKRDKDQDKGCGHEPGPTERVVVGSDGTSLANSVVYLESIARGKAWTGELAKGPEERTALLDQKGCVYVPHILPVRVETQVGLKNSDVAEHNVHTYNAAGNTEVNQMTPGESFLPEVASAYVEKPGAYSVKCDIHPWMNGYIWAFHHPYWAITGPDGKFEISGIPPGTYTLVCWHEGMEERAEAAGGSISYKYSPDIEKRATITVTAGGKVTQDFTLPAPSK